MRNEYKEPFREELGSRLTWWTAKDKQQDCKRLQKERSAKGSRRSYLCSFLLWTDNETAEMHNPGVPHNHRQFLWFLSRDCRWKVPLWILWRHLNTDFRFRTSILECRGSNLCWDRDYPDSNFRVEIYNPPSYMPGECHKLGYDRSLPYHFPFIIQQHPITRRCVIGVILSFVMYTTNNLL
jgi:hypothetical protein